METDVLKALNYRMCSVTVETFLPRYCLAGEFNEVQRCFAMVRLEEKFLIVQFLAELSLLDPDHERRPSSRAAAIVYLVRFLTGEAETWVSDRSERY